jgi:hypothetical protein
MQKMSSAEKAIEVIQAGQCIFVHGAAASAMKGAIMVLSTSLEGL